MGSINFSTRAFYDSTTEYIGVKSGLLLNRFQVRDILLEYYNDDFLLTDNLDKHVRLHSSSLEEMLVTIRQCIGNLTFESVTKVDYENLSIYIKRTKDISLILSSPSICLYYIKLNPNIGNIELAKLLEEKENYPKEISLSVANIGLEKYDHSCILPANSNWDGCTKLSDLFECEINSEDSNDFLDQKFIDYLAANGNDIEKVHWRNFEKFCAEYFKRQGRQVVLGPGTNDGGIDIRVFDPNDLAKPLILIQCKRYKKENKVSIETVKSFYSDVLYENATRGLIATSSYIATGGKKIRDIRGYNIDFAEFDRIKKWATEMWQLKP
ncbi:MAG: restriction endonuclease [Bacteroidota bacterium]